jgi:hypothetical protein
MSRQFMVIVVLLGATIGGDCFAVSYIYPQPYLAFDNPAAGTAISPFSSLNFKYFHLEDFEDGAFNTPGVSITENFAIRPPGGTADSVDGDDGTVGGSGTDGYSIASNFSTSSFTFNFSQTILGNYPTHAGIVWTDVGRNNGGDPFPADLINNVVFEAFDPAGLSLGQIGPFSLGDSEIVGQTAEDRFFGVINYLGVSKIRISMPGLNNWSVDHLQYGFLTPDFDGDGDVDGRDFLVWQRNNSSADYLAIWQDQYGSLGPLTSSVSVPEPSACVLLFTIIAAGGSLRWHQRARSISLIAAR